MTCDLANMFNSGSANMFTSDLANMLTSDMAKMFASDLANMFTCKLEKCKNMICLTSSLVKLTGEYVGLVSTIRHLIHHFFSMASFHIHCRFKGHQRKGRVIFFQLYDFHPLKNIQTFAILHLRWIPPIFTYSTCNYQTVSRQYFLHLWEFVIAVDFLQLRM